MIDKGYHQAIALPLMFPTSEQMQMGDDTPTLKLMFNGRGGSIAKSGPKILLLAILSLLYMLLQIRSYLLQLPEGKGISLLNMVREH